MNSDGWASAAKGGKPLNVLIVFTLIRSYHHLHSAECHLSIDRWFSRWLDARHYD